MSLGAYGGFPFKFGGTRTLPLRVEHQALLAALEPGYDPDDPVHAIETFVQARGVHMVWSAGRRLTNQANPEKMLEMLPVWEEILEITPPPGTSDFARRAAVAARMRGLQNNAIPDIEDVAAKVMGGNYEAVVTVDPALVTAYWPGGIPGPPGFEWCSNVATIGVRVNKNGLDDAGFLAKVARLRDQLDRLLPAWMTYNIGVGSDFSVGVSIVGQDFL